MISWRQRVRDLEAENQELRAKIIELERYLKAFDNAHTPSSMKRKKNTKKKEGNQPRFPGKPPGRGGGGIQLPPPDKIVEHTLDNCPLSGLPLGEPIGYRKKTIVDFPDKPIIVTEHRIMQYISPATGEIIEANVNLPNHIYGSNLRSIVAMLKNLTNSHEKIADFLRELGAPSFSTERVQNIADDFTHLLESRRDGFLTEIREAPYLHADETTMRKDGQNGYIWNICTPKISLFFSEISRTSLSK